MLSTDDLVGILGARPFKSAELRNIDKFRDGFSGPPAAAVEGLVEGLEKELSPEGNNGEESADAAAEAEGSEDQTGSAKKQKKPNLHGKIVAT